MKKLFLIFCLSLLAFMPLAYGSEWQLSSSVTSWTCPEGTYEIYVCFDSFGDALLLNDYYLTNSVFTDSVWLPAYRTRAMITWIYSEGTYIATSWAYTYDTLPNGWIVTTGDNITSESSETFIVRYREITESSFDFGLVLSLLSLGISACAIGVVVIKK